MSINWRELEAEAEAKIVEAGGLKIPGPEKLDHVLDVMVDRLDALINPANPLLELASDAALKALRTVLRAWLQHRYEVAREKGLVQ